MNNLDFLEMEEQKAVLTFFRTLSDKENEDTIQTGSELSFNLKNTWDRSFENDLVKSGVSLSYVLFPVEEEEISSDCERDAIGRGAGNVINMTEEERNIINLMKQQSEIVNPGKGSGNFATNQELNKLPEEHCGKVNSHRKGGGHHSPDGWASKESLRAKCQHISTDCTGTDCVCVAEKIVLDDTAEAKEGEKIEFENVPFLDDLSKSTPEVDVGVYLQASAKSSPANTKHEAITVALTGPKAEEQEELAEKQRLEQMSGTSCLKNVEEEKTNAEEDGEEEEKDAFLCISPQSLHPNNLKGASPHISITPAALANNPPRGSTFSRATFSPCSPTEKQIQLPALFSGLRVLRKGVVGPEHDTVALIRSSSQRTKRETFPDFPVQGGFLEQISSFLSRDKKSDEKEEKKEVECEGEKDEDRRDVVRKGVETEKEAEVLLEPTKPTVSSAEAAFDAFKAFFTPKPLKKDPAEKVDLEAVRKKISADKDALRALFEKTSIRTPGQEDPADCKVGLMYESTLGIKHVLVCGRKFVLHV